MSNDINSFKRTIKVEQYLLKHEFKENQWENPR